ncbi:hypothetical protein EON64_04650, partial [archaeon]
MLDYFFLRCLLYLFCFSLLCSSQDPVPTSEINALYEFYEATNGSYWIWSQNVSGVPWNFTSYDPDSSSTNINPCTGFWQGILCDCNINSNACNVVSLNLTLHNITGAIPDTISQLTYLGVMYLPRNRISGTLPYTLSNMTDLESLNLRHNFLTGALPDWLGKMASLLLLDLGHNLMSGNLTAPLFTLPNLSTLALQTNNFMGSIPSNIANLTQLSELDMSDNLLSGTLPSLPADLLVLRLQNNFFKSSFPSVVLNLTQLVELDLGENFFFGPVPSSLPSSLTALYLAHNLFDEYFPSSICSLQALSFLDVTSNLFSGPIPTCIGDNLTELRGLQLGANLFTDSVPANLNQLVNINTLFIWQNMLSGKVNETLLGFPKLTALDFSVNRFTGPLPEYNWTLLTTIAGYVNQFTGTLPVIYTESKVLYSINFIGNLLWGSIPSNYSSVQLLSYFSLSYNTITGPLFASFTGCPYLLELTVNNNLLTGTLSPTLGQLSLLYQISVNNNHLTGTIPSELGSLDKITVIDLSHNMLTGSIPSRLAEVVSLQQLYLNNNRLIGNLKSFIDPSVQEFLFLIDVSQNQLTGPIPTDVFYLQRLSSFAAASNCLSGSVPVEICEAHNLSTLVLDGAATAAPCRRKIFPMIPFINSFVLQQPLTGTIPACIFTLPLMKNLHMSANYLSGSLPDAFTTELVNLTLSRNLLTGSIPRALQEKPLVNLDLSYNRLHGGLVKNISGVPSNGSFYLQVNRLSGQLPRSLDETQEINILNGNLFTCPFDRSSLPDHDPNADIYICGSKDIEIPVIVWATMLGIYAFTLLVLLVHNTCDMFGQWTRSRQHSFSRPYRDTSSRRTTLEAQTSVDTSQAETDEPAERTSFYVAMNRVLSFWSHWKEMDAYMRSSPEAALRHILTEKQIQRLAQDSSIPMIYEFFDTVCMTCALATLVIFLVFMPIYASAPQDALVYQSEYGWKVSAVLLGGHTGVVILSCVFCLVLAYLVLISYRAHCRHAFKKLVIFPSPFPANPATSTLTSPQSTAASFRKYACLFIVAAVNAVVMIAVDITYVLIVLNYAQGIELVTQIVTAAFKIFWNDFALWSLVPLVRTILGVAKDDIMSSSSISTAQHSSVRSASSLMSSARYGEVKYEKSDVPFVAFTTLFNNIIVPAIAIACVSSTCFEDAIVQPGKVQDSYFSVQCIVQYVQTYDHSESCDTYSIVQRTVSYDPPFLYSYLCASTIYITYLPVFIYLFIFAGFVLPGCRLLLRQLMHRLQLDASSPAHSPGGAPGSHDSSYAAWKEWLRRTVPLLYQPAHPSPVLSSSSKFLSKEKLTVRCVSHLAILLVFGAIYPPLAIIGCVSVFLASYTEQYLLGSMVQEADWAGWLWYREKLSQDAVGLQELFAMTCWLLVPFACVSFAFLLFDTLGYTDGWKNATVVSIMVAIVWPLLVYAVLLVIHPFLSSKTSMQASATVSATVSMDGARELQGISAETSNATIGASRTREAVPLKSVVFNTNTDVEADGPPSIVSVDNPLYTSFDHHNSLYSLSRQDVSMIGDSRMSGFDDEASGGSRGSRATFGLAV